MSEALKELLSYFPLEERMLSEELSSIEEIRFIKGSKIRLRTRYGERELPYYVSDDLMQEVIDRSTGRSPHTVMEMIGRGFLILPGGHRLGICGTGVYADGKLRTLRDISSINIRVAKSVPGFGRTVARTLWENPGSALCMGPPGRGKTTLLRDVIFQLSAHYQQRIAVIDERQELAASLNGYPQFDLGPTTDIMSSVGKAEAMEILIRTMGPNWIAVDEITAEEDVNAMIRGAYCGVKFLATAHGRGVRDLHSRPVYRKLLEHRIFDYLFYIDDQRRIRKEELWPCSES